jgi:hypothetical protein
LPARRLLARALAAEPEGNSWLNVLKTLTCSRLIDPGSEWCLHRLQRDNQGETGIASFKNVPEPKSFASLGMFPGLS